MSIKDIEKIISKYNYLGIGFVICPYCNENSDKEFCPYCHTNLDKIRNHNKDLKTNKAISKLINKELFNDNIFHTTSLSNVFLISVGLMLFAIILPLLLAFIFRLTIWS